MLREVKIAFLRTNFFWFNEQSGGSVAHIAGVANGFRSLGYQVRFLSTDRLKAINERQQPVEVVEPSAFEKRWPYLGELLYNRRFIRRGVVWLQETQPDFLYHRHSLLSVAGAVLTRRSGRPLALEYNSPEGWKLRHWSKTTPAKQLVLNLIAGLTEQLERFALRRAAVIVAVSQALADRLIGQGVPKAKILVNPNGVDLVVFDRCPVINRYRRRDRQLVGFVGTFAHWHGADVLCRAVAEIRATQPKTDFVLIGDGAFKAECEAIIATSGQQAAVTFTGTRPHEETIGILKSCDILVSPHVPNPDGSPFFGSPTKLFEYMAAGRAIVASDLFQVGQILRAHQAGRVVKPGQAKALAEAISELLADPAERRRLGGRARRAVEAEYTWQANAARVIAAIQPHLKGEAR